MGDVSHVGLGEKLFIEHSKRAVYSDLLIAMYSLFMIYKAKKHRITGERVAAD